MCDASFHGIRRGPKETGDWMEGEDADGKARGEPEDMTSIPKGLRLSSPSKRARASKLQHQSRSHCVHSTTTYVSVNMRARVFTFIMLMLLILYSQVFRQKRGLGKQTASQGLTVAVA